MSQPAWSSDGSRVAYAVGAGIVIVRTLATGRDRRFDVDLTDPPRSSPPQVSWSPDGRHIVVGESWGVSWHVAVLDTRSGATRLLIEHTSDVNPRWSPDGHLLAYVRLTAPGAGELRVRPLAGASLTVARDVVEPELGWGYAWSPDSRALAFVSSAGTLSAVDADGSDLRLLASDASSSPVWSPDGSTVAYTTTARAIGLVGADGSASPLTPPPGSGTAPAWSPDGASLLFVQQESDHAATAIWTFATRRTQLLIPAPVLRGAYSPGGAKIYVTSIRDASGQATDIYDPVDDSLSLEVFDAGLGAWSPDGASMAFERRGSVEIVPLPAPGADWQVGVFIHGASDPAWQPVP